MLRSEGKAQKKKRLDFALQKLAPPLNVLRDLAEHLCLNKMMVKILNEEYFC